MIENFIHDIPTKYYFGKDVIKHLDEELRKYGNKILLAYGGGSIKRIGLYQKIIDILNTGNFEYTELSGIEPNPRIESVIEGVKLCREFKCDVILRSVEDRLLIVPKQSHQVIITMVIYGKWLKDQDP